MGDSGSALYPLCEQHPVVEPELAEAALDPAVLVVDAALHVGDVLSEGLDEVLDGLEDSRTDRSEGIVNRPWPATRLERAELSSSSGGLRVHSRSAGAGAPLLVRPDGQ